MGRESEIEFDRVVFGTWDPDVWYRVLMMVDRDVGVVSVWLDGILVVV